MTSPLRLPLITFSNILPCPYLLFLAFYRMNTEEWNKEVDNLVDVLDTIDNKAAKIILLSGDSEKETNEELIKTIKTVQDNLETVVDLSEKIEDDFSAVDDADSAEQLRKASKNLVHAIDQLFSSLDPEQDTDNEVCICFIFRKHYSVHWSIIQIDINNTN